MNDEIELTLCENGPLLMPGNADVTVGDDSRSAPGSGRVAICRCGGTGNAPFCDGSHNRNGFEAEGGTIRYQPPTES